MTKENLKNALALVLVEIDGEGIVQNRTFTDKSNGMTKRLPDQQDGYVWQGARYPTKITINVPEGQPPYRPGMYLLGGEIFESGKYGRLEFRGDRGLSLISVADASDALAELATEETKKPVKAA